jgi:hypothetical protein
MTRCPTRWLVVACAFGACALPGTAQAQPKHPALHRAVYELREARTELKESAHDFGGHREKALHAVDAAIGQIDKALVGAGDTVKGFRPKGDSDGFKKYKDHPHIRHALHELREAKGALENAKHDFGGHREQAIKDINIAMVQLEEVLRFPGKK